MSYLIKSVTKAPEFNCNWEDWSQAETTELKNAMPMSSSHHPPVSVRLLHDHDTIYGIFQTKDQYVIANQLNYQNEVCNDSCVEFFFKPSTGPGYFNLEMSAGGAYLFFYIRDHHRTSHGFADYTRIDEEHGKLIKVRTSLPRTVDPEITTPLTWTAQFAIPRAAMEDFCGPLGDLNGQHWTCNFYKCAGQSSHPHWITWAPIPELNFHLPEYFAPITFE
ncbi:MAG: carbohydrate-binding family 9-like protein [Victivallales bacterium]|nr:carbohydrate-binding family 9-like protein [Victivallales bacterium]